jgi:LCP family protein required for cell wall assembly
MTKIKIVLAIFLALLSSGIGVALRLQQVIQPDSSDIKENFHYNQTSGSVTILLVGVDYTEGSRRADSIAVATINIDTKKIKILSIPRDTRVQIPGHGWQKINHAYAFGGKDLLYKTIINYLGIPIDYFVVLNYDTFPALVDLVGGIDLLVEKRLHYVDRAGGLYIDIPAGQQHLDGKRALHYVRFRNDAQGDIGRVKRQQRFMAALLEKIKKPAMLPKLPQIVEETIRNIETNMNTTQALQLASYLKDVSVEDLVAMTLPGNPAYISGISYWLGDLNATAKFLSWAEDENAEEPLSQDLLSFPGRGDSENTSGDDSLAVAEPTLTRQDMEALVQSIVERVAVLNGNGTKGISKDAATFLQKIGVDVGYVGNAKHFDYHTSNILYPQNANEKVRKTASSLGVLCEISPKLIRPDAKVAYATLILGHDYKKVLSKLQALAQQ